MKKTTSKVAVEAQTTLVPEFYLNGSTFEEQYGILRLDRGIEAMFSKVTEESLGRLQGLITFGAAFLNKKGTTNVVAYKTSPVAPYESFKLGYVSNPSDELAEALQAGSVTFNAKKKIIDESMMSDF